MEQPIDRVTIAAGAALSPTHFQVIGNRDSVIVQSAGNVTVHLHQRPLLAACPIARSDLQAVRLAWVKMDWQGLTAAAALRLHEVVATKGRGLAVISGVPGTGRSGAALRALAMLADDRERSGRAAALTLQQITPDWDPPDTELLPLEPDHGYLMDVSAEIGGWSRRTQFVAQLLHHADRLANIGSCLILVADRDGWPTTGEPGEVLVMAQRPSPMLLCAMHLTRLHRRPELARRLYPDYVPVDGECSLAHLVKETMRPADAAELARLLAGTDGSEKAVSKAVQTFEGWRDLIRGIFDTTRETPEDRALLLAAILLEGAGPSDVQRAAKTLLGDETETDVRRILSGLDLASRLRSVSAEVYDNKVSFHHLPGFRAAVLRHVWTQLDGVQEPLKRWIGSITSSPGGGAAIDEIADLLADLAVSENDHTILPTHKSDSRSGLAPLSRGPVAARMLGTAALQEVFGARVRDQLRERWAKSEDAGAAEVAALVCEGPFAKKYPKQALVRLRWILDRPQPDGAVKAAERALRVMAADESLLPEVWAAVTAWITEHDYRAGRRAFLSLADPSGDPFVLQALIADAERDPRVATELVSGWSRALGDSTLADRCETVLLAWAHAVADESLPGAMVVDIIDRVVNDHLYTGPMAAFLMGKPGIGYPPAVIEMRRRLMERRGFVPALTPQGTYEGQSS